MKRFILGTLVSVSLLAALAGCMSAGRGQGPIATFAFLASANTTLKQNAVGAINDKREPKEIYVVVPPGTDLHGLIATLSLGKEAAIAVISSGTRVAQQNGATPNDFSVPVTYSIEVPGEKKPWTYTVIVREAETNARLSSLVIPQGAKLSPVFSAAVHGYTLEVPFASTTVRVEARGQSATLKSVTVDGAESPGATGAAAVDFQNVQERAITIETLAEDGVARERYTLTIRRGAPDANAMLGSLELQNIPLSPSFSPSVLGYQVMVPYETKQLAVRARPQSPVAALTLDAALTVGGSQGSAQPLEYKGNPADKAGALVEFSAGNKLALIVVVTAQDGSLQQYLVDIQRAPPDRSNRLSSLSLLAGPAGAVIMTPPFTPNRFNYIATVPFAAQKVTLTLQPQSRVAMAVLEEVLVARKGPGTGERRAPPTVKGDPGSKNGAEIDFGAALFDAARERLMLGIAVTAQDGGVQRYVVDVRRGEPDRNADLASIVVSAGTLSPAFSPRIVSYGVMLPAAVEAVKINAAAASPVASVGVVEQPGVKPAQSQSLTLPLAPGSQGAINFVVSAEDGSQKLYRVQVGREAAPVAAETGQQGGTAAQPGDTGNDHVLVAARNLKLRPAEANALVQKSDIAGAQARIIVRYYRSNEIVAQYAVPVDIRQQGNEISLSLSYTSNGVALNRDRLVEVEIVIPTPAGHFLYYAEARASEENVRVDIPFLLYGDSTRTAWPAIGTPVSVSGYLSRLPPGKERAVDKEEFEKNSKGESGVTFELVDAKTGVSYGKDAIWSRSGQGRDHALSLAKPIQVPEGAVVKYFITAVAKNGKAWKATGSAQVWTTLMSYPTGFQPVILPLSDDLSSAN
jgi:hypothetical protein